MDKRGIPIPSTMVLCKGAGVASWGKSCKGWWKYPRVASNRLEPFLDTYFMDKYDVDYMYCRYSIISMTVLLTCSVAMCGLNIWSKIAALIWSHSASNSQVSQTALSFRSGRSCSQGRSDENWKNLLKNNGPELNVAGSHHRIREPKRLRILTLSCLMLNHVWLHFHLGLMNHWRFKQLLVQN